MQLAHLPANFIVYRFLLPAIVGKGISSKFTYVCARRLNLIESAPCEAVPEPVHVLELDDGALAGPTLHGEALSLELTVVDGDDVAHEVSAVVTAIDPESL